MNAITGKNTAIMVNNVRKIRIAIVVAKNPVQEFPLSDLRIQTYAQ